MVPVCAACNSTAVEPVSKALSETTKLYRCTICGLAFCYPLPDIESPSAGPNSLPTGVGYTAGLLDRSHRKAARYRALAEGRYRHYSSLLGRTEFRMLEIGCGACGMAATYQRLGIEYWGIDIDPRVVRCARESGVTNVSRTDFFDFSGSSKSGNSKYDVICFSQVLEHIKAPEQFLDKVASLMAADGIVHCDVPNHHSLPSLLFRLPLRSTRWGAVEYPQHLYAYTRNSLRSLFSRRFSVEVFDATVGDPVWGQAGESNVLALCGPFLKLLHAGSLLVAYGVKTSNRKNPAGNGALTARRGFRAGPQC
jgi:SAM-dependent methyltransferase